ncbi:MAG: methylmalonyl Co-A mutase-associated GTPase MeaB [Bacteroidota bacterium]
MEEEKKPDSALKVNDGIEQPSSLNEDVVKKIRQNRKKELNAEAYIEGILSHDRVMLSRAITLVESTLPKHQIIAQEIIEKCLPHSANSIRIGITGVPGAGKSTFIEAFGKHLTSIGRKLAVLAIDPSSQFTKGSILGDKTRMEYLSTDPNAFIRPSPSAGSLGGVARMTRESIILCEAAGFDTMIVETVGVGQSETAVNAMVDFFLLLMIAGAGDELQGIKRGIMEMADAIVINKADGENKNRALIAKSDYARAVMLFPPTEAGWETQVDVCSSITKEGIGNVWGIVLDYCEHTKKNGYFEKKRTHQAWQRMIFAIQDKMDDSFFNNTKVKEILPSVEKELYGGKISSFIAAQRLLDAYFGSFKK